MSDHSEARRNRLPIALAWQAPDEAERAWLDAPLWAAGPVFLLLWTGLALLLTSA